MSVQNPNRVVTKQDLADFYQGILPYLGGMPEMLANKFSKGDMYSTDEKMIGQWIDGKPLYQKTLQITETYINITSDFVNLHNVSSLNIENLVYTGIHRYRNDGVQPFICDLEQGYIRVKTVTGSGGAYYGITDGGGFTVIQYTKTTDSAVSIGSDTDYSTDEKIVGTWIDGKPIWQRTFTTTISTTAAIPTNTQFWEGSVSLPSGLNIDRCWVDINHSTYLSNPSNPSTRRGFDVAFYEPDNNDIYFIVLYERTNAQAEFVIQYTKTS